MPPAPAPALRTALLEWFDHARRDLPWRQGPEGGRDPYRVWVAEILLQQTQVSRGRLYYERFLDTFPTVQALAAAPQDAVLKAWEGCGYYARARNLHRAAGIVAQAGFPTTYDGWLALPGVGPYTAAAVSSLAYGAAHAVSDGNVRRVLARVQGERQPTDAWVQAQADALLDPARPAAWNEAVMDLGATVCTPKAPDCPRCPLREWCAAYASGEPTAYPAPKRRAAVQEIRAAALLVGDTEHALLEQRTGTLLGGLFGLPLEEVKPGEKDMDTALTRLQHRLGLVGTAPTLLGEVTHAMTHRRLQISVYWLPGTAAPGRMTAIGEAALSRLDHKALALLRGPQRLL
ncbi:A/G-specific adenine glycosylase [Deinococcus piscis]|uniref:Adenine DNA glycosylase n=1 Tax=Deinococcus piscis TaxID=394230 RepID=A0ABQ3K5S3_9DEIO|nr:A/G-specific adenine glycosylase [Deinococcus piscis]GHG00537.1 A/G-specific adenine glycosylase [Deinococcus piscis]